MSKTITIPAITLWQPWATLMAIGAKQVETRSWPMPAWLRGQLIAIHAAQTWNAELQHLAASYPFRRTLSASGYTVPDALPRGCVVAVVRCGECRATSDFGHWWRDEEFPRYEHDFGDYSAGRYAWVTDLAQRIDPPIPAQGKQGIWRWEVPADLELLG